LTQTGGARPQKGDRSMLAEGLRKRLLPGHENLGVVLAQMSSHSSSDSFPGSITKTLVGLPVNRLGILSAQSSSSGVSVFGDIEGLIV
jgi:hypothetical protein